MREGEDPYKPRILLSRESEIFLDGDPAYKLMVESNAFQLSYLDEKMMEMMEKGEDLGPDNSKAMHIVKYRIEGERAISISP